MFLCTASPATGGDLRPQAQERPHRSNQLVGLCPRTRLRSIVDSVLLHCRPQSARCGRHRVWARQWGDLDKTCIAVHNHPNATQRGAELRCGYLFWFLGASRYVAVTYPKSTSTSQHVSQSLPISSVESWPAAAMNYAASRSPGNNTMYCKLRGTISSKQVVPTSQDPFP